MKSASVWMKRCALGLWVCAISTTGFAQDATETPTPVVTPEATEDAPEATPVVTPEAKPEATPVEKPAVTPKAEAKAMEVDLDDPAWAAYRRAFSLCADQNLAECQKVLRQISEAYKGHPAASLSLISAKDVQAIMDTSPKLEKNKPRGINGEPYSTLARAELMSFQTIHGIVLAGEFCVVSDCSEDGVTGASMLGGSAGLALSWLASRDGITSGHTLSLNSGVVFGALNGGLLSARLEVDGSEQVALMFMAGQAAGLGLGHLHYRLIKPTSGQVALTNSGGLWMLYSMLMSTLIVQEDDTDPDSLLNVALLSANGGLIVGGMLAHRFPMSRSRVTVIDTGGFLGAFVGGGLFLISDADSPRGGAISILLGSWAGLAGAVLLTDDWDDDNGSVQRQKEALVSVNSFSLLPTNLGAPDARADDSGWTLRMGGQW